MGEAGGPAKNGSARRVSRKPTSRRSRPDQGRRHWRGGGPLNGWLLDTNVVASLSARDGAPSVKAWAAQVDERRFYLSIFTLAEYDKGVAQLSDDNPMRAQYALRREQIEARFAGRILPVTNRVVRRWGELAGRIKRDTGHPPKSIDTLIAATAIEANLWLATRNTRDVALTGATLFNPWLDAGQALDVDSVNVKPPAAGG